MITMVVMAATTIRISTRIITVINRTMAAIIMKIMHRIRSITVMNLMTRAAANLEIGVGGHTFVKIVVLSMITLQTTATLISLDPEVEDEAEEEVATEAVEIEEEDVAVEVEDFEKETEI